MVIKSKVFIKCNTKEFDSWDFCKNWISNSNLNCIFLVGDYHIWSFTDVERKSVGLEPVVNTYQLSIHSDIDIVNVTVGYQFELTIIIFMLTGFFIMHSISCKNRSYLVPGLKCLFFFVQNRTHFVVFNINISSQMRKTLICKKNIIHWKHTYQNTLAARNNCLWLSLHSSWAGSSPLRNLTRYGVYKSPAFSWAITSLVLVMGRKWAADCDAVTCVVIGWSGGPNTQLRVWLTAGVTDLTHTLVCGQLQGWRI